MAEPDSKSRRKFKYFWMAEPGHPHAVGVLHNRHPAAGTHEASANRFLRLLAYTGRIVDAGKIHDMLT
jgi:hypothetical protein